MTMTTDIGFDKAAYVRFTNRLNDLAEKLESDLSGVNKKDRLFMLSPVYKNAAEIVYQFPHLKNDVVQAIVKLLPGGLNYSQVNTAVDQQVSEIEEKEDSDSVRLAPAVIAANTTNIITTNTM